MDMFMDGIKSVYVIYKGKYVFKIVYKINY